MILELLLNNATLANIRGCLTPRRYWTWLHLIDNLRYTNWLLNYNFEFLIVHAAALVE